MENLALSLRQRKILYTIQQQDSYITGKSLADMFKVTARTIRNDIVEINHILKPYRAEILSVQSKGYLFQAENPEEINQMNRIDHAFFTKEDRIRYLAFRLCLADEPLNLYDLEDEIFTSHTTLLYDLHAIKKNYAMSDPYIHMNLSKNEDSFEQDERKLRAVLLDLFHKGWDYNFKGNAFYGFHFLDEELISFLAEMLPKLLLKYNIYMEDPSLVALKLSLAIMYHRIQTGHLLASSVPIIKENTGIYLACRELFDILESYCKCSFSTVEKDEIYSFLFFMHVLDGNSIDSENASAYFGPVTLETANAYIQEVNRTFQIDFSNDKDFYKTLVLYLRELQSGKCIFSHQQNLTHIKRSLLGECEFAYLFQKFAVSYMGRMLNEIELTNLAVLFSGALSYYQALHPEKKLRTVLCCHENFTTNWALKRQILSRYHDYVEITDLLPIHSKDTFDFSDTDLILTTIGGKAGAFQEDKKILIDPNPGTNLDYLSVPIQMYSMRKICHLPHFSTKELFSSAYWHERETFTDVFSIIEKLASDFIHDGIAQEQHLFDILSRETHFSFVLKPGIVLLSSHIPAAQTRLSFMSLDHRVMWNDYKIRVIVMALFRKEDILLLFYLKILFYSSSLDANTLKNLKSREEITHFFLDH